MCFFLVSFTHLTPGQRANQEKRTIQKHNKPQWGVIKKECIGLETRKKKRTNSVVGFIHFENDNIYIIGHSLDVTYKEVFKELLCHPHANVYIVYHDKQSMRAKISNMLKVIG